MKSMQATEVVKNLYLSIAEKDYESLVAFLAEEFEWIQMEGFPGAGTHTDPERLIEDVFLRYEIEWSEWDMQFDHFEDTPQGLVVHGRYLGTHAKSQRKFRSEFVHVFRVRAGKVSRFMQMTDTELVEEAGE